jgi:hypothetical protein
VSSLPTGDVSPVRAFQQNLWMIGLLHGLGDFFIDGIAMIK